MKEYIVSLDIMTSSSATDSQLSEFLGLPASMLTRRETDRGVLWRLESDLEQAAPFDEHVETLLAMIPKKLVVGPESWIYESYLTIGILYDTLTCSILLPKEQLHSLTSKCPDLDIQIICYPCEEEEEEEGEAD